MSWGFCLLVGVLAAVLGYAGGVTAWVQHRRRHDGPSDAVGEASFVLEHVDGQTWSLRNVGDAAAHVVSVVPLADGVEHWPPQPAPGAPSTATSERLPTLAPGASLSLWLSRFDRGQQVLVGWTSDANVRMGPVTLDVPVPVEKSAPSR